VVAAMAITRAELREKKKIAACRYIALAVADDYDGYGAYDFLDYVQKKRLVLGHSAKQYKKALAQAQKSFKPSDRGGGRGIGGSGGGDTSTGTDHKKRGGGKGKWSAIPPYPTLFKIREQPLRHTRTWVAAHHHRHQTPSQGDGTHPNVPARPGAATTSKP
jgi:hypothetical protein